MARFPGDPKRLLRATSLTFLVGAILLPGAPGRAVSATTERASLSSGQVEGSRDSYGPSISADGRYVVFFSYAPNLVGDDTNARTDAFVRDRQLKTTERVSLSTGGVEGNGNSLNASISADGRFVVFESGASNIVRNDTNHSGDIFLRDRKRGTTKRVSVGSGGAQANGVSLGPSISANGRFVAFVSYASNLVDNDTNGVFDIFVRDRKLRTTQRVSVSAGEVEGNGASVYPSISADGRFVAFGSSASNLVENDTNDAPDIFVHDLRLGTTERVSVSSIGSEADGYNISPAISADGRFVAFQSGASNLVHNDVNDAFDIFVHDRELGKTRRVSQSTLASRGNANGISINPSISANGRFVAFESYATNLVENDTIDVPDIFVRDMKHRNMQRVSVTAGGFESNAGSTNASISADGRFVAFQSYASNLVDNDANWCIDVFVRGPLT